MEGVHARGSGMPELLSAVEKNSTQICSVVTDDRMSLVMEVYTLEVLSLFS